MPTRDTAQLILEVDARIATAQRAVNQLARSIQQDTSGIDGGLKKIEQSGDRVARSLGAISGRTRSGFTQLSFQIGDVSQGLAMGTKASTIFAQQSGQVIQALQIMGGEGNKFLQFLGGPWGLALSTAAVVLGALGSKLFDTGDGVGKLVDKMREQARQAVLNRQADDLWKGTVEGLTEAIRKRREEQEKSLQTDVLQEESDRRAAQKELDDLSRQRDRLAKQVNDFVAANKRPGIAGPGQTALGHSVIEESDKKLAQMEARLADINKEIALAEANVRGAEIPILDRRAEARVDAVKSATDVYNASLGALHAQYTAGQITLAKYNSELDRLKANLKKVQDATKEGANDRQSGRQVSFAEATSIAKAAGLQVNSGYRSPADQARLFNDPSVNRPGNPVAAPGASAHNGANGKWAIDIQITDGVTPAKIRKVFADQGVSLTKVLKEQGHFHVEGSRSEAAAADRAQATEATKTQDRAQAFQAESERIDAAILQARSQLVHGIDAEADYAIKQIQLEQDAYGKGLDRQVADNKLNAADAEALKAKYATLTFEKAKAIETQRSLQNMQRADEADQRSFQYQVDDLRFADEMATTQAEHRRLQGEILDVVYQQKEAHLKALKAELELAGKIEDAADVQKQIDRLPTDKAHDQARVDRGTMSPLEAWAHDVPKTAAEINQALQSIEVQGINNLADAIAGVVTGTQSLGAAFKSIANGIIADIIRMTIKMLIFRAISGLFGGGGGGVDVSGAGDFSGSFKAFNMAPVYRAAGGPVTAGQPYIVGERRPELFVPNTSGVIVPQVPKIGIPKAANGNGGPIEVHVMVDTSEDLMVKAAVVADSRIQAHEPRIIRNAAGATLAAAGRRPLMGR
jgi:hypothetical protein